MGLLTFAINLTLDGCHDHREGIADAELHDIFTGLIRSQDALLFGRVNYEMMEAHWPAVAKDASAARDQRDWAIALDEKPKYVVSGTRREYPWKNSFHLEGDLATAVNALKEKHPKGVLIGGPTLAKSLEELGLIDEYRLMIHPVISGKGPTLFHGLGSKRHLELVSTHHLKSGVAAHHYRRQPV